MATAGDETARPPPKGPCYVVHPEPKAAAAAARVELNPADCDLDFEIGGGGLRGHALHEGGSAYCWSGARATVGVRGGGRYCFGSRVVAEQPIAVMEDADADQRHLYRVGVSRGDDSVCGLGQSRHSFGFEGTGKFSHRGKFFDYGGRFVVGDTIVCAVDLDSKPIASIGFSKNREWLGVAQCFDASETGLGLVGNSPVRTPMRWESAIFPHVLLKNVVVEMQFSREDGLEPVEGYEPWISAFTDGNAVSGPVFAEQEKCEVMMMVGLPASGKSTWAEKWVKDHPEKRFVLLGTNLALDQMKMTRLLGKNNYDESFDRFMARARMIFKTLLDRAVKIPRNYIIDRRNLSKIERIRTLSPFVNHYKSAVVVFPSLRELKNRSAKRFRKTWQAVSSELVDLLAASFVLPLSKDVPGSLEPLDEVIFVENSHEASQRILDNLRHSDGSGTNSTRMSIAYQPDQGPIHPLGVQGCVSTAGSQNQIQSSSNAPHRHLIQETSTKPVDEDFILFRTFDLYEEFESMDFQHGTLTELSKSAETTQDEIDALWDLFRVRIDKCREIRREIRSARGYPPPIPEWFLA